MPIMKALPAADRGTGIFVTCPVCLRVCTLHPSPLKASYLDRFSASGRQLFLFWWRAEQGSRKRELTFVAITMFKDASGEEEEEEAGGGGGGAASW